MMIEIKHLLTVADEYRKATKVEDKTISSRVFADSKKLTALRSGSDLTITRFNEAMRWFSENWPAKAKWPEKVSRPSTEEAA